MRKYLLPIFFLLLLYWSCEEDPYLKDCAGVEGGSALVDSCGICDDDPSNDCIDDCAGEWGGDNICGCADSSATNYDSNTTFDDGSCEYFSPLVGTWSVLSNIEYDSASCQGDYVDALSTAFWGGDVHYLITFSGNGITSYSIDASINQIVLQDDIFNVSNCSFAGLYFSSECVWADSVCVCPLVEESCDNLGSMYVWENSACVINNEGSYGTWSINDDTLCIGEDDNDCGQYNIDGNLLDWTIVNEYGCQLWIMEKQ